VQMSVGEDRECETSRNHPDYSPRVRIENYGWGAMRNVELRYAFKDPLGAPVSGVPLAVKPLGTIKALSYADFAPDLAAGGVQTAALARSDALRRFQQRAAAVLSQSAGLAKAKPGWRAAQQATSLLSALRSSGLFGNLADKIELISS